MEETEKMNIVYILTNPVMPDLVKLGRTDDVSKRIQQLSSHTGVPVFFELYYACEVKNAEHVESNIQDAFKDHRINAKREFFRIDPDRIVSALRLVAINEVYFEDDEIVEDAEEKRALDSARKVRSRFRFSIVGIQPGAILTFKNDDSVTAKVINDREIELNGEIMSTSGAARQLLRVTNPSRKTNVVQGPHYWLYEGETLLARRERLEDEDSQD